VEPVTDIAGRSPLNFFNLKFLLLGVNLKWDKHINPMTAKANQSLGFIKRKLELHLPTIKEHAFKVLVRPKLEYCNTIWNPHTQQQKLQIGLNMVWQLSGV
jgi:ribosomal protein L31E